MESTLTVDERRRRARLLLALLQLLAAGATVQP